MQESEILVGLMCGSVAMGLPDTALSLVERQAAANPHLGLGKRIC